VLNRALVARTIVGLLALLASSAIAVAQSNPSLQSGSAHGQLTVTATVVASVGVVTGPDGQPKVIFANGAAPSDSVSFLQAAPEKIPYTPLTSQPVNQIASQFSKQNKNKSTASGH